LKKEVIFDVPVFLSGRKISDNGLSIYLNKNNENSTINFNLQLV
jgi:hypothetical protein